MANPFVLVVDTMIELLRSNDPVKLSWVTALLADSGIIAFTLDQHMSVLEGSAFAISCRLMVAEEDAVPARRILVDAGELGETDSG